MKKILIVLLLTILTIPAFTEGNAAEKGNFVVSLPVLSYQSQGQDLYETPDGEDRTTITIMAGGYELGIQYFIISGLAVGGNFGISAIQVDNDTTETILIEPMITYYLSLKSILPYLGVGYSYNIYSTDSSWDNTTDTKTSMRLKAGAAYMFGSRLSVFGEASYNQEEYTPDTGDASSGNTITFALGFKAFF